MKTLQRNFIDNKIIIFLKIIPQPQPLIFIFFNLKSYIHQNEHFKEKILL